MQQLVQDFYIAFAFVAVGAFVCIALVATILLLRKKILASINVQWGQTAFWACFAVLVLTTIAVTVMFINFLLDIPFVEIGQHQTFTGEMVGYTYVAEGNSPSDPVLGSPVFRDVSTGETRCFSVGPCQIGQTYTIIYLPHTKIAKIVATQ